MQITIESILFKNLFWLRFKRDFNLKLFHVSNDIHFTISNHPNSSYINFHLTKHFSNNQKVNIRIAQRKKELSESMVKNMATAIKKQFIKPVNIKLYKKNNHNLLFIVLSKSQLNKLEHLLIKHIDSHSSASSKRYRINSELGGILKRFLDVEKKAISRNLKFTYQFNKNAEWAYLKTSHSFVTLRKLDNRWYKLNNEIAIEELLSTITNPQKAKAIKHNTLLAIKILTEANTKKDVESHSIVPIRL